MQIFYISNFMDTCNETNVNITYQVMGRQHMTQNMIHENLSTKYIQVYIDYLID